MPPTPRQGLAVAIGLAALAGLAPTAWTASPYHVAAPDPGPCDVVVNEANAATTLAELNDPDKRVFCVDPGDYRDAGILTLATSGTEASPRFLRFHADDGIGNAVQRSERAIFQALRIPGSWWVVEGLTVQPHGTTDALTFINIHGDHNLIEGNLVDGSEHDNLGAQSGIVVAAHMGDPATDNVIQDNVIRSANRNRLPMDYDGIQVAVGGNLGEDNDRNRILDNEVYDWGDGIAVSQSGAECSSPGVPHGTIIDGNDVYITSNKRADCATGAPDPEGDCACAEDGIDLKPDPGADPASWTRVTNNRLWGFRPTSTPSCGGSGGPGYGVNAGNECPEHVFVAGNIVLDAARGIHPSSHWIVAGNLVSEVDQAIMPRSVATGLEIQFNTITEAGRAYDDWASDTNTLCNVVIDTLGNGGDGGARGVDNVVEYNFLYNSPAYDFEGPTNELFATAEESQNTPFCFWRKRWTAPEWICVPFGWTTPSSPHAAAMAHCGQDLGAPFGLGPIDYDSIGAVPEPAATQLAMWALLTLALLSLGGRFRRPPGEFRSHRARRTQTRLETVRPLTNRMSVRGRRGSALSRHVNGER